MSAAHPDAVVGRFVTFRSVHTRGVTVLTVDVPLDKAHGALRLLGAPTLGSSIHVGFTRLQGVYDDEDGKPPPEPQIGTFETYKMVADREALALTIEVPLERAHLVLDHLGMPVPDSFIQVAIVRLKEGVMTGPAKQPATRGAIAIKRCAVKVNKPLFQRFVLGDQFLAGDGEGNALETIKVVRERCRVRSRAEFGKDHEALERWEALEREYEAWLQSSERLEEAAPAPLAGQA